MLDNLELAYIAGIVDGEGSISIVRRHRFTHQDPSFALLVSVSITDEWVIHYLHSTFGGSVSLQKRNIVSRRPVWSWTIRHKQAGELLKAIYPFLHIKKAQAEIAIRFQARKKLGKPFQATRKECRVLEQAEKILVSSLNKGQNEITGGATWAHPIPQD